MVVVCPPGAGEKVNRAPACESEIYDDPKSKHGIQHKKFLPSKPSGICVEPGIVPFATHMPYSVGFPSVYPCP